MNDFEQKMSARLDEEFEKMYKESPFPGRTLEPDAVKLAMRGSFMAGGTAMGEILIKLDKDHE